MTGALAAFKRGIDLIKEAWDTFAEWSSKHGGLGNGCSRQRAQRVQMHRAGGAVGWTLEQGRCDGCIVSEVGLAEMSWQGTCLETCAWPFKGLVGLKTAVQPA